MQDIDCSYHHKDSPQNPVLFGGDARSIEKFIRKFIQTFTAMSFVLEFDEYQG